MKAALPLTISFLIALSGCSGEAIDTYPPMPAGESMKVLVARSRGVSAVSCEGLITLTAPDGQSVRLDGAVAMQAPDRVRMRAWKLGRAVFDLTVTPKGVWMLSSEGGQHAREMRSAGISTAHLARAWSLLSGRLFEQAGLMAEVRGGQIVARYDAPSQPGIVCEIDRSTLTARRYTLLDEHGSARMRLVLDRYQRQGQAVWPMRIVAESDRGQVRIDLRRVELNQLLPEDAFVAPRRAEKLP
jgi:hypothetical protein